MPKIKRQRPPAHILIPDTNVLWHDKKDTCASPEFDDFWNEYGTKYDIELTIPSVVKGELIYQHTRSALTTLDRINAQFSNLSGYANKDYKHRVKPQRVKNDISSKFDSWITANNAEIVDTPVSDIDWTRLINDSIWRKPPFEEDKDKKNEKGFRDALILETVVAIAADKHGTNLAFISNDVILRDAVKDRLKDNEYASFYESLDEFSSFLRLIDEQFTNDFIQAIRRRARYKFFRSGDAACLLSTEKIIGKIREEFDNEFSPPEARRPLGLALSGIPSPPSEAWEGISDEGIWIHPPNYIEHKDEKVFFWDSRVTFVKLYRNNGAGGGSLMTDITVPGQENLRKLEFKVIWKSNVSRDARFRSVELVDIELAEKQFQQATEDDKERYGIEVSVE